MRHPKPSSIGNVIAKWIQFYFENPFLQVIFGQQFCTEQEKNLGPSGALQVCQNKTRQVCTFHQVIFWQQFCTEKRKKFMKFVPKKVSCKILNDNHHQSYYLSGFRTQDLSLLPDQPPSPRQKKTSSWCWCCHSPSPPWPGHPPPTTSSRWPFASFHQVQEQWSGEVILHEL